MKANYFFRCVFFSAAILFFACGTTALAVGISTTDKYAWSENSGWLSFRPTHGGASVYYDHLEGYAWSESIGFIRLGSYTGGGSHYYANTGSADWGVNKDASGNLFGYAWSENAGWISFNSSHSQVTIAIAGNGSFDGYAWSESVGWIHFKGTSPAYNVLRINDAPVIAQGDSVSVTMDEDSSPTPWSIPTISASDAESEPLAWTKTGDPSNGTASVSGSGAATYSPNGNWNGTDSFVAQVYDTSGGTDSITVYVTVNPVNDAPVITGQNSVSTSEDTALSIGHHHITVTDIDNSYPSGFGLTAQDGANYTRSGLAVTPNANFNGTLSVPVKINDGLADSNVYNLSVTVTPVDDGPLVSVALSDVTVSEDAGSMPVSLASLFTDIDNDNSGIVKSVISNSNPGLVSATVSGDTLTLACQPDQNGTASVTIRGTSNGKTADDTFTVTVNATDDALYTANPIADVTADEDAADTGINLGAVFTDIDNDDGAITKALQSNSNPSLLSATVSGNTLTLDYQPDMNGTASVTIRGTSNGKTADDTFTVTVNATDDALTVAIPITDVTADEDAADTGINLGTVFTDIDNDDGAITKAVQSNSNPGLVSATVSGNTLTLDYQENQNGTASVTIRGTSNGKTADDTFTVTVNATDDALYTANPIADVTADEDAADTGINLGTVFTDIDNDDGAITKAVQSNSNPGLVSATVSGNTLTLDYQENQNGTASVTVRGTSGDKTADDTFTVTVNPVDDPPFTASPLGDITTDEDSADTVIELDTVFSDADNDDSAITKSVQSNTGETIVAATVSGNTLTLDYQADQSGTAVITIVGTSGGQTATDDFIVTVSDVNNYISGKITYYSNGDPVSDTLLTLAVPDDSDTSYTATAGQTGAYLISSIPSGYDYVLTPSKDDDPGPETLSSLDSSKIARASIGLVEITELERLAADVTGNGRVSGLDASRVAKYKSGLISQMNDTGKHWTFSPVSAEYSSLDSDMENQDFTAMRLGDISGTWKADPLRRSGYKNQGSEVSETSEVSAKQGTELSVPVVLETAAAVEGIDITTEFDKNVLEAEEVTLADSILENEDYALVANTGMEGKIIAVIYAKSYIFTGTGTVATLKFRLTGEPGDSALLTFREFECNRIPVSGSSSDYPDQSGETLSGGFYTDGRISQSLKITVEKDKDIMIYDLNRDGRVGLQDAVRALRQGNLEAAIQALQCVTGK